MLTWPIAMAVPISPTYKPHYFFRHGGWWRIVYRGAPKAYKTYMLVGAPWDDQSRLWPAFPQAASDPSPSFLLPDWGLLLRDKAHVKYED